VEGCEDGNEHSGFTKCEKFFDAVSRSTMLHGVVWLVS